MAGFSWGTSKWDDIPQKLGLRVEEGYLRGAWRGVRVEASFYNEHVRRPERPDDDYYEHYTRLTAFFDPPILVASDADPAFRWLDAAYAKRLWDGPPMTQVAEGAKPLGLSIGYGGEGLAGTWREYEQRAERFAAGFDLLAWGVGAIEARHAADPAPWEVAMRSSWPRVAAGWQLAFDPKGGKIDGQVQGRRVTAGPAILRGDGGGATARLTTEVGVAVALPAGCKLSLSPQDGDGFFKRLFRGQDIEVGDAAFDAAFVVKGEPEPVVKALLGPATRHALGALVRSGAVVDVKDGMLEVWATDFTAEGRQLDELLRYVFQVAAALGT